MANIRHSDYGVYSDGQQEHGTQEDVRIAVPAKAHKRNAPMSDAIARPVKPRHRDNTASKGDA